MRDGPAAAPATAPDSRRKSRRLTGSPARSTGTRLEVDISLLLSLQPADDGRRAAPPAVFVVAVDRHVADESRPEAGETGAAGVSDASIDDSVGAGIEERPRVALRVAVAIRVVERTMIAEIGAHVREYAREGGPVLAHLEPRVGYPHFG